MIKLVKISLESSSNVTADVDSMILRENNLYRILYSPKLVINPKDPKNCVSGAIILQKKGMRDKWEDYNHFQMSDLKIGEWGKINLTLSEISNLINYSKELKNIILEEGLSTGEKIKTICVLDDDFSKEDVEEFNKKLLETPENFKKLKELLNSELSLSELTKMIENSKYDSKDIVLSLSDEKSNEIYDELKLKFVNLEFLKSNIKNPDEEFWQVLFKDNPNILFSIIPSVGQIIANKPYVGGKTALNCNGKFSDFFMKCGESNISIVEIKTPCQKLVGNEYRVNLYSPSVDLTGAITQLKSQKNSLLKDYRSINNDSEGENIIFKAYDPKLYLIIGNTEELNVYQKKSFELFRKELREVEIITYDELIKKIELIVEYLS